MSFPALPTAYAAETGLEKSARLMQALGASSARIWNELSEDEAARLTAAMDKLGPDMSDATDDVADQFLRAARQLPISLPQRQGDVWRRLSALEPSVLAGIIGQEHPQTVALILSKLEPAASAGLAQALPAPLSVDALRRLLHLGAPILAAVDAVEDFLSDTLTALDPGAPAGGHERVARIFDRLSSRSERVLLAALESAEPGAGTRVRALMFTFDDLSNLDAGGLQTLLAACDRSALTLALKGAKQSTHAAFFTNLTQHAGAVLRDEISALGPVRRSEVEAARAEIVSVARGLIKAGDIRMVSEATTDELVE